jgi:2-keto-4-pentenoate hydratase/2-oxohepta-3-ene-1,7-dioic acid hydratase in catechol pathway
MYIYLYIDDNTPWGPCIVAAHAFPDPQNTPLKCVVNGETLQNGNTKWVLKFDSPMA